MFDKVGTGLKGSRSGAARPSVFSKEALAFAVIGAVFLCWPALLLDNPGLMYDSQRYYNVGWKPGKLLFDFVGIGAEVNSVANSGNQTPDVPSDSSRKSAGPEIKWARSIPYSVYVYVTSMTPAGLLGPILLQNFALLLLVWAAIAHSGPRTWRWLLPACLLVAALTPLPWFASYLMPDILAAAVLLFYALLATRLTTFDLPTQLFAVLFAAFAMIAHIGHLIIAGACMLGAFAILALDRRLQARSLLLGMAPLLICAMVNVTVGLLAFGEFSIAPRRMPLALVRSIEDGPARRHLEEKCDEHNYAFCEIFEEIPENAGSVMWSEGGLQDRATPEDFERIREEELIILWRSLTEHPLEQATAAGEKAVEQLFKLGLGDVYAADVVYRPNGLVRIHLDKSGSRETMDAFETVHVIACGAGLILLVGLLAICIIDRRVFILQKREWCFVAMVVFGVCANAAIFGALSAPAERYQSRVIWLLPLSALIVLTARAEQRSEDSESDSVPPPNA